MPYPFPATLAEGSEHHYCCDAHQMAHAAVLREKGIPFTAKVVSADDSDSTDGEMCKHCQIQLGTPLDLDSLMHAVSSEAPLTYFTQCDKWRTQYENGESCWHIMMCNRVELPVENPEGVEEAVRRLADLDTLLDEDETLVDFMASDPESGVYLSMIEGEAVLFIQTAGFEFIFTKGGNAPAGVTND